MATVVRFVDPDATGTGTGVGAGDGIDPTDEDNWTNAYTSLATWESTEQTDLVSDGDSHVMWFRSGSGSANGAMVQVIGWTMGASNTLEMKVHQDNRHDGKWNTSKARIDSTTYGIIISEDYVTVEGFQVKCSHAFDGYTGIRLSGTLTNSIVSHNFIWMNRTDASAGGECIESTASGSFHIFNNICFSNGNSTASRGIYLPYAAAGSSCYQNTIVGSYTGLTCEADCAFKNNLISGAANVNVTGTGHSDSRNNMSDDTSSVTGSTDDETEVTFTFEDAGSDDYHLGSADTGAKDKGVSLLADGRQIVDDDIDGDERSATPDCGADERVGGASTYGAEMMHGSVF